MSKGSHQEPIKVTLVFGVTSNAALVRELSRLPRYSRAKLCHKLIQEGLRSCLRQQGFGGGTTAPRPDVAADVKRLQNMPSAPTEPLAISAPTESEMEQDALTQSVLDQLGKTFQ